MVYLDQLLWTHNSHTNKFQIYMHNSIFQNPNYNTFFNLQKKPTGEYGDLASGLSLTVNKQIYLQPLCLSVCVLFCVCDASQITVQKWS